MVDSTQLIVLAGLVAASVLVSTWLSRRIPIPEPVFLVLFGAAASFISFDAFTLSPDLVFFVFLPALVYRASFLTSPRTLRRHALSIILLAIGLVVATAFTLAATLAWLTPLPFGVALVLGAALAPTDPSAVGGLLRRARAPRHLVDVIEGESLINDASALVLFGLALTALSDTPSVWEISWRLVYALVASLLIGAAVAFFTAWVRRGIDDPPTEITLSLVTPYLAYLLADHAEASGVLATVTAGVILGARAGGLFRAPTRLQSEAFWSVLEFVFASSLFFALGLQLPVVTSALPNQPPLHLVGFAALTVLATIGTRLLWQFGVPSLVSWISIRIRRPVGEPSWPERLLVGWCGIRGALSLAVVLSIPLELRGAPFPNRSLILFLAFTVILFSLVVQGGSLPYLIRRTPLEPDEIDHEAEDHVRAHLADVALMHLDRVDPTTDVDLAPLRARYQLRLAAADQAPEQPERLEVKRVHRELLAAQRRELEAFEHERWIPEESARRIRRELDLEEIRYGV